MEMTIKCPDCGKDLKITVEEIKKEAPKVSLFYKVKTKFSWSEIADMIHSGDMDFFSVGNEISCTLKNGKEVTFVVAHINPYDENEVAFVLKDCLQERHTMIDMRKYLNEEIYDLLPDDLKAVIKKRTIKQRIDGEIEKYEDKLWLLSKMEIEGEAAESDVDDVHFDLFHDERSRVKQIDGETMWYWLRSPYTSTGCYFWSVGTNGVSDSSNASGSYGVAFGFLI